MTTLTMRMVKGDFIVTGPDIEPMKFKTRREARDWCKTHHPGSPITEVGPGRNLKAITRDAARRGRYKARLIPIDASWAFCTELQELRLQGGPR
jgi:hypothetical protein